MKLFGRINTEKLYDTYFKSWIGKFLGKFDMNLHATVYLNYKDERKENDEPHNEYYFNFTMRTQSNGGVGYSVEDFLGSIRAQYFHSVKNEEREMTEEEYYKIEKFVKEWKNEFDETIKTNKKLKDTIFMKKGCLPQLFDGENLFEKVPNHFEFIEEDIDEYFKILKKK